METNHELYCEVSFLLVLHFIQQEERESLKKSLRHRIEQFKINGYQNMDISLILPSEILTEVVPESVSESLFESVSESVTENVLESVIVSIKDTNPEFDSLNTEILISDEDVNKIVNTEDIV